MSIEVRNVSKRFNAFQALDSINLDIHSGELVALLGPSGCGKTTLLRIIAGLETPDAGNIVFHGEDVSGHDVRNRNVGFVFQHYALFRPHEVSLSRSELDDHRLAEVRDIRPLGAITRVTLKIKDQDELIEAEVVKDHDSLTGLIRGESLFFKPRPSLPSRGLS